MECLTNVRPDDLPGVRHRRRHRPALCVEGQAPRFASEYTHDATGGETRDGRELDAPLLLVVPPPPPPAPPSPPHPPPAPPPPPPPPRPPPPAPFSSPPLLS